MLLNAKLSQIFSQKRQFKYFAKNITKAALSGGTTIIFPTPYQFIYSENLTKLSEKGYDIKVIASKENPSITVSWKEGKKENGIILIIDSDKILNNLEFCEAMYYDSDSDSEQYN